MFEMKKPLFPLVAFRYDKIIIEIREWVRAEKSAIIHCAMGDKLVRETNWLELMWSF